MLPKGWKRATLADIGKIKSGATPPRAQHERYFSNGSWPWVKTMDLTNAEIETTDESISDAALNETQCRLFSSGTVLVAMYGGFNQIGRTGLLTRESATNQAICAIELDTATAYPAFVLHWLNAHVSTWKSFAASSRKDPNITRDDVCGFPICLPSIKEQRRIAGILATWDKAITTMERLLVNCSNYWRALIGKLLMPVPLATERQAGSYPPSVQSGIPKLPPAPNGWRKVALGAHLHEINRPVILQPDAEYTLVTVRRSRGGVDKRVDLRGSEIKTPTQFSVACGDFLISKRQIVHGACGIVPSELDGAVVSNEYTVLGTDGEIDPRFLRYLSETTYFQQTCFHSSIGVHVEKMLFRLDHWLKWPFNIPPVEEQRRIVEILDAAKRQIELAEQQLALLKAEKRALMQQLLTGKRRARIPAAEAEVGAS